MNTKQGYFDRLLLKGLCDNAKRKGKKGGRENTYKSTKLKSNYQNHIVTYKKGGCEDFASGLAQNLHPFVSIYFLLRCVLVSGAKRRHLSMTSTRRGAKL